MPENIDKSSKVVAAKECNKGVASGGVTKPGCGGSSVKGQPSREGEVISDWRDCVPESPPKGEEGSKGRPCERKAKGEGIEAGEFVLGRPGGSPQTAVWGRWQGPQVSPGTRRSRCRFEGKYKSRN